MSWVEMIGAKAPCLHIIGAVASLALFITGASAQDNGPPPNANRVYLEARIGSPLPDVVSMDIANTAGAMQTGKQEHDYGTAFVLGVMAGYYVTENFRIELEASHGHLSDPNINFVSGFPGNPFLGGKQKGVGSIRSYGLTAAALYDLPVDIFGAVPFVGVGGGVSYLRAENLGAQAGLFRMNDSEVIYVGCLLAGFHYRLRDNLDFTLRYSGIFRSAGEFSDLSNGERITASFDSDFNHGISFGFRIFID
jgi:outer membrane protein W